MPRGSFKHEDGMTGFGFQEGNILITKSVVAVHQFPPNAKTGVQSAPLTAMRWTGVKLDENWKRPDDPEEVQIITRLGAVADMRPGKLRADDAANLEAEPEDLGEEVDTEGNSLFIEAGKKTNTAWVILEDSLRKCGFKPEISGRGYAPDFEGMEVHLKSVAGNKYTDKGTGEEKTPMNLIADRINKFPYDKKGKGRASAGTTAAAPAQAQAADGDLLEKAKSALANPSDRFKGIAMTGKPVLRKQFQLALMQELMAKKIPVKEQSEILNMLKNDEALVGFGAELGFLVDGDSITYAGG